jgi:hypothetical protein
MGFSPLKVITRKASTPIHRLPTKICSEYPKRSPVDYRKKTSFCSGRFALAPTLNDVTYYTSAKGCFMDCALRVEELNRCAVVFASPPFFAKDNLFPQPIQSGLFVGAC